MLFLILTRLDSRHWHKNTEANKLALLMLQRIESDIISAPEYVRTNKNTKDSHTLSCLDSGVNIY